MSLCFCDNIFLNLLYSQNLKSIQFYITNSFTEVKACSSTRLELPNLWRNTFHWELKVRRESALDRKLS